ncbi:MAG TPA: (Fe-S)-binding protein [Deltaproteobacteria bacterium]|nr:(Fe-S)-binding protein [Deltaproteobacteria bacterium]
MKANLTKTRELLSQYREDYALCSKCKICHGNHVQEVNHARFFRNCPSGSRFRFEAYYASGRMELARALNLKEIEVTPQYKHALYTCMECGSCQEQCYPVKQIWPLRVIELLREKAVAEGWGLLPEHEPFLKNLEESDNLLGKPQAERDKLIKELDIKDASKDKCETLLFIGCQYAFKPAMKDTLHAAVNLLKKAGTDVGVLGSKELCCGAPLLELGDRDFFEAFATENIKRIDATGAQEVITLCSHCASVMTEEYASFMEVKPRHITQYISAALEDGKLKASKKSKATVAWHDPCRLGRRLKVYDEPRAILDAIPGLKRVELERNKGNALCCGNGGMAGMTYPEFGLDVAKERIFEAEFCEIDTLVTSCPWCEEMLQGGIDGRKSKVKVENILTLLDESVGGK